MMQASHWFDELPVIGKMAPEEMAAKLSEVEEDNTDDSWGDSSVSFGWPFSDRAWQHTSHIFGFIPAGRIDGPHAKIQHAGNIDCDISLKHSKVNITLDRLRVADYPGGGIHHVLFDFYARHNADSRTEHIHFNTHYRIREGEQAAIIGYPIFSGLNVSNEGVALKCYIINVKNEADEAFLKFLDSDVFKEGLKLAGTLHPAVNLLSHTAMGITSALAKRHRNIPVQDFFMGLDFSDISTRARLAEGSYLAAQVPERIIAEWDWDAWVYDFASGRIVGTQNPGHVLPYNYVVFSVSRYVG